MRGVAAVVLVAALTVVGAIALSGPRAEGSTAGLQVVAAENVWGSIAAQLGGGRAHVTSVIASPATDPHDYEPTAADARALARAQLAIVNGVGYDPWAPKLLAADPARGRIVLTVGDVVGVEPGGNPHRWYSPEDVQRVAGELARDYAKLDPKNAAYFEQRQRMFRTHGLAQYRALIAAIRRSYRGVPVGASESSFTPRAHALGIDLLTPPSFLKAISEGTDPTAKDTTTIDGQIAHARIEVWIVNSQNSTPDVTRLTAAARSRGIPVAEITETLAPASATFQAWQSRQLRALQAALVQAAAR
jgi:zinc/manganese transport system substrate-binding protein